MLMKTAVLSLVLVLGVPAVAMADGWVLWVTIIKPYKNSGSIIVNIVFPASHGFELLEHCVTKASELVGTSLKENSTFSCS